MTDEAYIEMRCYVKFALHFGFPEETIKSTLIKAGWPLEKINRAILEVRMARAKQAVKPEAAQEEAPPAPQ
ncbi:MAG: hypothetical protein WC852_06035 [Candidatus Nanoarchaeia archaeon]|jgi:hypothetical protein